MKTIERDELKAKLDRGDDFKLVMTLGELAFQAQHIPGSLNLSRLEDIESTLEKNEIVIYCSDNACIASQAAYIMMDKKGYSNVRRYAGGLSDWSTAGYPLEGFAVE